MSLCVHIIWNSWGFLDLNFCFLPQIREVFSYYFFKYFLTLFLSLFFFWDPYNVNVILLDVVPKGPLRYLYFLKFYFVCLFGCPVWVSFIVLCSSWLICSSASSSLLLNPSSVFFSSFVTSVYYFLIFSISSLKFTLFIHSPPEFGEHLYDHYFEFFIRCIVYLCFD